MARSHPPQGHRRSKPPGPRRSSSLPQALFLIVWAVALFGLAGYWLLACMFGGSSANRVTDRVGVLFMSVLVGGLVIARVLAPAQPPVQGEAAPTTASPEEPISRAESRWTRVFVVLWSPTTLGTCFYLGIPWAHGRRSGTSPTATTLACAILLPALGLGLPLLLGHRLRWHHFRSRGLAACAVVGSLCILMLYFFMTLYA